MARMPGATWLGPTVNEGDGDGRPGEPEDRMTGSDGAVVHIAEGSFLGTAAWQMNPEANVSSHFIVAQDGRIAQMVDTADRSWCQVAGNARWYSIENEGFHGQDPTPQQIEAMAQIYAWLMRTHGVPARVTDSTSIGGLGWHGMGGAAWGGHYDCPGDPFKNARPAILARALQINGGNIAQRSVDMPGLFQCPETTTTIWMSDGFKRKALTGPMWADFKETWGNVPIAQCADLAALEAIAGPESSTTTGGVDLAAVEAAAEKGAKAGIDGATIDPPPATIHAAG